MFRMISTRFIKGSCLSSVPLHIKYHRTNISDYETEQAGY